MDLEKKYYEVKSYIDTVDFAELWRGFEPLRYALYTDRECFFDGAYIEKTESFIANTSILYNGEWIAIWNVQEEIDSVVLASKIIHEMFHGFQSMHNDSRFPDELDALYNYKYEEDNLDLKLKENNLLCHLSEQFDEEAFGEFLEIRKYRCSSFGYAYRYESSIEQIEGAANYVELLCLKQLSAELFENKLSQMRKRITDPDRLFPVRVICYDIGALLLYVLKENGIAFDDGFSSVCFSEAIICNVEEKKHTSSYSTKDLLTSYNAKASEIIQKAKEKNVLVSDRPCELLGVNVYNAVFFENHIISKYFVMFGTKDDPRIEYGDFVIESGEYKKATKIYRI